MMYTPSKKTFLLSLAVLGAGLLVFFGFLFLIFSKIGALREEAGRYAAYSYNTERALQLKKESEELSEERALLESFFVTQGEEAYFVESLESLARRYGLRAETEALAEGQNIENGFAPFSVSLRFEGSFAASLDFLGRLESLPQAITVEGVDMTARTEGGGWSTIAHVVVLKLVE